MADFAHYLRREVIEVNYKDKLDPWFSENQPDKQGFDSPSYHVTRATSGPASRVSAGDVIWLFSQLATPWGNFPPSLDAKICVRAVVEVESAPRGQERRLSKFRYEAAAGSKWFPLFDAAALINRLRSVNINHTARPLFSYPGQHIGQALQSMRELADAAALLEWEHKLDKTPPDFISYRLLDGTRLACEKALQLVKEGRPVFWDRWSLPRRLAERREFLSHKILDAHLHRVMARCRTIWGIRSDKYGERGSYSARELMEARRLRKLRLYPS